MTEHPFILIPGRSTEQGTSVADKASSSYREATRTVRMNPADMERLGIVEGGRVRIRNAQAAIEASCVSGKDELPVGVLFIAYGPDSSRLMSGETGGTGMPDSKGMDVEVARCE
jgi:formylmethanofuran dehydrogenase subunit D